MSIAPVEGAKPRTLEVLLHRERSESFAIRVELVEGVDGGRYVACRGVFRGKGNGVWLPSRGGLNLHADEVQAVADALHDAVALLDRGEP